MRAIALPVEPAWADLLQPDDRVDVLMNLTVTAYLWDETDRQAKPEKVWEPMTLHLIQDRRILGIDRASGTEAIVVLECFDDEALSLAFAQYGAGGNDKEPRAINLLPRNPDDDSLLRDVGIARYESILDIANLESVFQRTNAFAVLEAENPMPALSADARFAETIRPGKFAIAVNMDKSRTQHLRSGDYIDLVVNLECMAPVETPPCNDFSWTPPFFPDVTEPDSFFAFQKMKILRLVDSATPGRSIAILECYPPQTQIISFAEYAAAGDSFDEEPFTFLARATGDDHFAERTRIMRDEWLMDMRNLDETLKRGTQRILEQREAQSPQAPAASE
jgi:hypothetical protein